MSETQIWYIVKRSDDHCEVVLGNQTTAENDLAPERWGPFASQDEAFARRVGLIRAGKCQPV